MSVHVASAVAAQQEDAQDLLDALSSVARVGVFPQIRGISRIRRNMSIHIVRFSASESLRVYTKIYKNSPPFASR